RDLVSSERGALRSSPGDQDAIRAIDRILKEHQDNLIIRLAEAVSKNALGKEVTKEQVASLAETVRTHAYGITTVQFLALLKETAAEILRPLNEQVEALRGVVDGIADDLRRTINQRTLTHFSRSEYLSYIQSA